MIRIAADTVADMFDKALEHHQAARHVPAELLYKSVLDVNPRHAQALHFMGVLTWQTGRAEEATRWIARSLALEPRNAQAHSNLGNVWRTLGRIDDALRCYQRAVELAPKDADLWTNVGVALREAGRADEAEPAYRRAITLRPASPVALNNLGNLLVDARRHAEALQALDDCLELQPRYADAWGNRGRALHLLGRFEEALASCDQALALNPALPRVHLFRGNALIALEHYGQAAAALAVADRSLPDEPYLLDKLIVARQAACEWDGLPALIERAEREVLEGRRLAPPFDLLLVSDDPRVHQQSARVFMASIEPSPAQPLWTGERYKHQRIRVAYLSADFRDHATAYLAARLFELHDTQRFEVMLVSYWRAENDEMRQRLEQAPVALLDADTMSDREVAEWIHGQQIDIAVDLMGLAGRARPNVLAHRPAPIQVNWLGYPATMGASHIDYLVADRITIPPEHALFYEEHVVRLPESYQVNDDTRPVTLATPTREQVGLPDKAFVFCCFNKHTKILPPVFDVWARLLRAVPGSVLWLFGNDDEANTNLRREAERRGVEGTRLIFASTASQPEHLARHRLADLALDTLPYNAHTTASDALWAGLPMVTCSGRSFASRVGASLLHAVGLPELVTRSLGEYETLALELAINPGRLHALRQHLHVGRSRHPLFDSARFTHHLECAFTTMVQRQREGLGPAAFDVAPGARA